MKPSILIPGLAMALCVPLAGCNPAHNPDNGAASAVDTDAAATVTRTEADMLAAFKARDAAKVAALYAEDAVVATPGRVDNGRAAAAKSIANDLRDPGFSVDFTNEKTDVAASGDMAYTRGTFRVTYTNPGTKKVENVTGNYVTVFRKQADGSWKAVADYATPGAPPPA